MHDAEYLALYHSFRLHQCCLIPEHQFSTRTACLRRSLMQVGLGLSQVYIFRSGDDADGDAATIGIEEEGVEQLVIVDEEVEVEPEGVGQYNFGEFGNAVGGVRSHSAATRLLYYDIAGDQFAQQIQVVEMCSFPSLFLEGQFLLEHKAHELVFAISYDDDIDLFSDDLVLHMIFIIMVSAFIERSYY